MKTLRPITMKACNRCTSRLGYPCGDLMWRPDELEWGCLQCGHRQKEKGVE